MRLPTFVGTPNRWVFNGRAQPGVGGGASLPVLVPRGPNSKSGRLTARDMSRDFLASICIIVNDQEAPAQSAISEDMAESAKCQVLESNQDPSLNSKDPAQLEHTASASGVPVRMERERQHQHQVYP